MHSITSETVKSQLRGCLEDIRIYKWMFRATFFAILFIFYLSHLLRDAILESSCYSLGYIQLTTIDIILFLLAILLASAWYGAKKKEQSMADFLEEFSELPK